MRHINTFKTSIELQLFGASKSMLILKWGYAALI